MKTPLLFRSILTLAFAFSLPQLPAASHVTIEESSEGRYDVKFGGQLFTTLHTEGFAKPILYPVIGPHGVRMTRDYPMKKETPGEARDHAHHQSLWFTHGSVNGVSFWHLGEDAGRIETTGVETVADSGDSAYIILRNRWVDAKGKVQCTDRQKISFHKPRQADGITYSALDYEVTLHASEGDVVFGDTKEGTMGIRSHPALRISNGAEAVNSEGVRGKAIWGKRAKWVDYSAEVEGHTVGFAIMDHPSNPRHPTWWHARDYGLVAANPFGVHDFERKPAGTGDLRLPKGDSLTLRYRFVFHGGDAKEADIAGLYQAYARR